jgi:hypothetical protein
LRTWLIVLVLEALGLGLWWNGGRSGDDVQAALGGALAVSVALLFIFRLLVDALNRWRDGSAAPKHKGAMLDVPGALALSAADSVHTGGPEKKIEVARAGADRPDSHLGAASDGPGGGAFDADIGSLD